MNRLFPTLFAILMLATFNIIAGSSAQAAPVTLFTTRATFNTASLNRTTLDFEGIAANGTLASYSTAAGLTLNGVNFVGGYSGTPHNYYFLYVAGRGYVETGNAVLEGPPSRDTSINASGFLRATLPTGVTSVGTDYRNVFNQSSLYTNGMSVIVTTSDNQSQTFTLGATNSRQFVGFSVTTPGISVSSLQFSSAYNAQTGQRNYPVLDNFTFGQSITPVPEPTAMLLLGTGLLGISAAARRKR